jgi:carboxypeptidase T
MHRILVIASVFFALNTFAHSVSHSRSEKENTEVFLQMDKDYPGWRSHYRSFDSVQKEMKSIADSHPQIAVIENYGKSDDGLPLNALRLTGNAPGYPDKPELMITSLTHGDEVATVEVVMDLVQSLAQGYGSDARATQALDKHVLYFVPVVCPNGYLHYTRSCNGVDPNRNYPYPGNPNANSIAAIRNETVWFATHHIVGSIDIHANLSTVMYPWAYTSARPPEEDVRRFQEIGRVMANDTGYNFGQISDVFGIAKGSSADYWYWKAKSLSFGYEISGHLAKDRAELDELFRGNQQALMHFIDYF